MCPSCWCGACGVPAAECPDWPSHCKTTRAAAMACHAAARTESLRARLQAVPRPPPLDPGCSAARLMAEPRWGPMRFTALSWLANCGSAEEGVSATVSAVHGVSAPAAQALLASLQSLGEVIALPSLGLHVRPGTNIDVPPAPPAPLFPLPPQPQPPPPPQPRPAAVLPHDVVMQMLASAPEP